MNKYIQSKEEALEVLNEYLELRPSVIAVDTETTGLNYMTDRLFLAQVGWGWNNNYAFPVEYLRIVAQIIEDSSSEKVFHNAKFDMHFLERAGVKTEGRIHDTAVMARLLLPKSAKLKLKDLAPLLIDPDANEPEIRLKKWMATEKRRRSSELTKKLREIGVTRKQYDAWKKEGASLPPEVVEIEQSIKLTPTYEDVPFEIMEPYATGDVKYTLALYKKFMPLIQENRLNAAYERDMRTIRHVYGWEKRGMAVDLSYLREAIQYGSDKMEKLMRDIRQEAGSDVNLNSPLQVKELFHARGFKHLTSVDEEALESIADADPLASKIVEYRKHSKLLGTYFKPIYERASRTNGRIHGTFNVATPVTGRFSSSDPNLQNIPNYDLGEKLNVRRAFVPSDDFILVFMDYSQMEVVIMAEYSKDPGLVQAILNKEDIHTKTALSIDPKAKELYVPGLPKNQQPEEFQVIRSRAKQTTFGLFYGIGAYKLSKQIKTDVETARQYIQNFFRTYPKVEAFIQNVQTTAMSRPGRYVINKFGRVYWGERNKEYALVDYLIQGSGADMAKIAIDRCERLLAGKKSRMVSMVHDELIFEIALDELDLIPQLKEQMTYWPEFELPIEVSVEYAAKGMSWADSKPWPGKENFLAERVEFVESA